MLFTVIVVCKQDNIFAVRAKTIFSLSLLPGRYSPMLGTLGLFDNETDHSRGYVLDGMCVLEFTWPVSSR